jgi:ribosomal protein S18 acetylase RimI-like enzyme
VFSPKVETGWDSILQEAKEAGIPVIMVDRDIKVEDESLYTAYIGSDFSKEGEKAVGGYTATFEKQAQDAAKKMKESMKQLAEAFQDDSTSGIKDKKLLLQGDSLVNVDSGKTISQFDTIITKANDAKVAIANINGVQVKIEFDKNGAITNVDDVKNAINGLKSSPAKIGIDVDDKDAVEKFRKLEDLKDKLSGKELKQKVTIDGTEYTKVEDIINKVENWPAGKDLKINIDGEDVSTIDGVLDKLGKVPKETNTKITVNGDEVSTIDEAKAKLDEIAQTNPNATITINGEQIGTIDEAKSKLDAMPPTTNTTIQADNTDAKEITYQNSIYFGIEYNEEDIKMPEDEEKCGMVIYMGEVDNKIIGKVHLEVSSDIGGIFGLGVIPNYRGKGYGREILMGAIEKLKATNFREIMLQVAAKNNNALNLYKSCGFVETSTMDYYQMSK